MGRRGPRPTPTAILAQRGSWRAKIRDAEPEPDRGAPDKPSWLSSDGAGWWDRLAGELDALGVLTKGDAVALGLLCDAVGKYVAARDAADHCEENRAFDRVYRLCKEFGMSPASRASVRAEGANAKAGKKEKSVGAFFKSA